MKQTNLFLNDLLDMEMPQSAHDVLWKACKPVAAEEKDGAVVVRVPFQAQRRMDFSETACMVPVMDRPKKTADILVRSYGGCIIRLTTVFDGHIPDDNADPMFQWDPSLSFESLSLRTSEKKWEITDTCGNIRMRIDLEEKPVKKWGTFSSPSWDAWLESVPAPTEAFQATVIPDGTTEVPFMADDTFFPGLYNSMALGFVERNGKPCRCFFSLKAKAGEKFAGTGERFAGMDLSGGTYLLENTDAHGVNNKDAYKNIPFYVSSVPYGLFMHTSAHIRLSLADISTRAAQALIEEDCLDLFFIGGGSLERIVYNYRRITGFPGQVPFWSFGAWISRCTYHSAEETVEIAGKLRKGGYPYDVLCIDPGWFDEFWKCDWKFSRERFPDPAAYFAKMREMGFRVCLWQCPVVAKDTAIYRNACEKGYVSRKAAGNGPDRYGTSIDFTNPGAVAWYQEMLKEVLGKGAALIKTDFGEDIDMDLEYMNMPPEKLHNLYALLYQKAAFEAVMETKKEGIIWARAGWAGCQRYPVHWGGDCACTWDGLAGSIRGGLHLGISGFAFWSCDVPGFHGIPDLMNSWPDSGLYVRWTQAAVFTSHIRYHGTQPREPYEYPEVSELVRKWLRLRYCLIPYLADESEKAVSKGLPVFRAMVFHHEADRICWNIDDQFYCGDNLLVAPVLNPQGIRDVYLPSGSWTDVWTGEVVAGPKMLEAVEMPLERIPVYARTGSAIRVYPEIVQCTDEMDISRAVFLNFDSGYHGITGSILGCVTGL